MSIDQNNINDVIGSTVYGADGEKIGKVGQVYLDDQTGKPEWVTVKTGLFGTKRELRPARRTPIRGDGLTRALRQGQGQGRPARRRRQRPPVRVGGGSELYRYYGLEYSSDSGRDAAHHAGAAAPAARRRRRHEADGTRRPRHLGPDHRRRHDPLGGAAAASAPDRETGRARLRKYVVTEKQPRHRAGDPRGGPGRARADHRRQPGGHATARTSPRRSTRSSSTRSGPSSTRRPSRSSASASTRRQVTEQRDGHRERPQGADRDRRRRRRHRRDTTRHDRPPLRATVRLPAAPRARG